MPYRCLADFLEHLSHAGEMVRVEVEVDPVLEAAEVARRSLQSGGPALLLGNPAGQDIPLLVNLLASESRICRALEVDSPNDIAERLARLANPSEPEGWFEKLKTAPSVAAFAKAMPRRVKTAVCQQIVRLGADVNLDALPAMKCAPDETGRTITAGLTFTAHPDSHHAVVGRWDVPILDRNRVAIAWADDDEPARLLQEYRARGERMPIAIVLGGDPAILLAAEAPVPVPIDVAALAGLLRENSVDVVACRDVDLAVPADAEIVLEGHIDPATPPEEVGPLATLSGVYARPRRMPVVEITAVTHRANPVFPAMVSGAPPHEAGIIAQTLAKMFLPLVQAAMPEVADFHLPMSGGPGQAAVLAIHKTHAGQARRVAQAAWAALPFRRAKLLVLVDAEVDVHDPGAVLSAIHANAHLARDAISQNGPPDPADPTTLPGDLSHQIAIDATRKLPGEHAAAWPNSTAMSEKIQELVNHRWAEYDIR